MENLIGKEIINFQVEAYHNGQFKTIRSEDTRGRWSVFFFYPADFTFVCPTELEDLAEAYGQFQAIGCEIYSVSTDTHFVHKAWADVSKAIQKVRYPMLADPGRVLVEGFGVMVEASGQALRGTFIVNPEGEIKAYEINDLSIGRNIQELLRKVQAAQYVAAHGDAVCPSGWQPGDEAIKPDIALVGKL